MIENLVRQDGRSYKRMIENLVRQDAYDRIPLLAILINELIDCIIRHVNFQLLQCQF